MSCVSPLFHKGSASEVVIKHHLLIHVQIHPGLFETELMEDRMGRKFITNRVKESAEEKVSTRLLEFMFPARVVVDFVGQ